MENSALLIYKAIGAVQNIISNATTRDEALQDSLKAIVSHSGSQGGAIWYAD